MKTLEVGSLASFRGQVGVVTEIVEYTTCAIRFPNVIGYFHIEDVVNLGKPLTLFSRVKTPDGIGVLICVSTPSNGLYFEPERAEYTVWYGVNAYPGKPRDKNCWTYRREDLEEVPDAAPP